jgi:hypothetical protein
VGKPAGAHRLLIFLANATLIPSGQRRCDAAFTGGKLRCNMCAQALPQRRRVVGSLDRDRADRFADSPQPKEPCLPPEIVTAGDCGWWRWHQARAQPDGGAFRRHSVQIVQRHRNPDAWRHIDRRLRGDGQTPIPPRNKPFRLHDSA